MPGADTHDQDVHSYPSLTFLQGGDLLALTHPEGVALWDTETGKEAAYIGADLPDFAQTPVISPDGCRLGYASEEGGVHVFDRRRRAPDRPGRREGHHRRRRRHPAPAHSPDGARLAVTGPEATAVVDTATGDEVFRGPAATASSPNALALPAPDLLFYLHEEGIVRADLSSGEEPRVIAPPDAEDRFGEIAVPPGGDRIHALIDGYDDETGDYRPELTVWDADTGDRLPAGEDPRYVRGIAVHPEGTVVAGLNPEGTSVLLLDPETLDATAELG
ncbi:WD40 repeat domain-containing protein [Nocardiopsis composta]